MGTGKLKVPLRERKQALNHSYLGKHLLCVALYSEGAIAEAGVVKQQHRLGLPVLPVPMETKPSAEQSALLLPASQARLQPGVQPICQV